MLITIQTVIKICNSSTQKTLKSIIALKKSKINFNYIIKSRIGHYNNSQIWFPTHNPILPPDNFLLKIILIDHNFKTNNYHLIMMKTILQK